MERAIVPAPPTVDEVREVAYAIQRGVQDALLPRLGVLMHEENVAAAVYTNLVDEFAEGRCRREVDVGVGLHAVAVASADQQIAGLAGQLHDGAILTGIAQTVQLERVDPFSRDLQKTHHLAAVNTSADDMQVPDRMIEEDEHAGNFVEVLQDVEQDGFVRTRRVAGKPAHPGVSVGAGKIVYADVKFGWAERQRPLHRDRDVPRAGDGAQQHGSFDGVVVGDGDKWLKTERLDRAIFEVVGHLRQQGRTPMRADEVELEAGL